MYQPSRWIALRSPTRTSRLFVASTGYLTDADKSMVRSKPGERHTPTVKTTTRWSGHTWNDAQGLL